MRQVFISYRRADTGVLANQLAESIRSVFGRKAVFIDSGDIPAGSRWADMLNGGLEGMFCVLCVIGLQWTGPAGAGRRIDDPNDWVRREIGTAVNRGIPVLPIVSDIAHLPAAGELPEDLRPILDMQALTFGASTATLQTLIDWLTLHLVPPIRFVAPLVIDEDSLGQAGEAFGDRLGRPSRLFAEPASEEDVIARVESDRRACLVRQPVVWDPSLIANADRPGPVRVRDGATDLLRNVERRLTSMWVGLVRYSGLPSRQGSSPTPTRAAVHLLCFAALRVLHVMRRIGAENRDIQPPLKDVLRWEEDIDRFFAEPEEIAEARVARVSGIDVLPEPDLSIYGPRSLVERSYEDSRVGPFQLMSTSWYGEYFAPQLELLLAASGRDEMVRYDGMLSIRKIGDLEGKDLPFR